MVLDQGILKDTALREWSGLKEKLKLVERDAWYLVLKLFFEGIVSSPVAGKKWVTGAVNENT